MVKKEFDNNCNVTDEIKVNGDKIMKKEYNRDESIQKLSIYKVDDELKEKGYQYDEARIYIPYVYKNPNNPDCRDIYLAISRHATNECKITYWWCKNVEGKFYGIEKFERDNLPCEEKDDLINALKKSGIESNLDYNENSFIELFDQIKKDISSSNCLEVLKDKDFDFMQGYYFGDEVFDSMLVNLNRGDLRKLIRIIFDIEYLKVCEDENMIKYDLIPCLLSENGNHDAHVYKHCYVCENCNPPVKLDQYTLIKKAFDVETYDELHKTIAKIYHFPFTQHLIE